MNNKIIYLPVQHVTRDLAGSLLLADQAVSNGWYVVLLKSKWFAENCDRLPIGVAFYGTSPTVTKDVWRIKDSGHFYVAYCDEAGLWNERRYLAFKAYHDNLSNADLYLAWGDLHAELVRSRQPEIPIAVTGNPRMDLSLRYAYIWNNEVNKLKQRVGQYILITSNGLTPVSRYALDELEETARDWSTRFPGMSFDEHRTSLEEYLQNGTCFWEMVKNIVRKNSNVRFVYRPRFGDQIDLIQQEFSADKNVTIIPEGGINPLLHASRGVIHQNCTSGLEAVLSERPTIDYSPVSLSYPFSVVENVLLRTSEHDDIQQFVRDVWDENAALYMVDLERLQPYIVNVSGPSASERVIDAVTKAVEKKSQLVELYGNVLELLRESSPTNEKLSGIRRMSSTIRRLISRTKRPYKRSRYSEPLCEVSIQEYLTRVNLSRQLGVKEIVYGKAYLISSSRRDAKKK